VSSGPPRAERGGVRAHQLHADPPNRLRRAAAAPAAGMPASADRGDEGRRRRRRRPADGVGRRARPGPAGPRSPRAPAGQQHREEHNHRNRPAVDEGLREGREFRAGPEVKGRDPKPAAGQEQDAVKQVAAAPDGGGRAGAGERAMRIRSTAFMARRSGTCGGRGRRLVRGPGGQRESRSGPGRHAQRAPWPGPPGRVRCQKAAVPRLISASGTRNFHARRVSWSIRRRGSVARIQMKPRSSTSSLTANQA
jgi:hypothetical protein